MYPFPQRSRPDCAGSLQRRNYFADLANGGVRYSLRQGALKKTVLDVICAVEDQKNLFAVFDRSTELYSICKDYFDEVDQQLMELLKAMTIFELLVKAKTAADNGS